MTKDELKEIARYLDKETQKKIQKQVNENMEILKDGQLSKDELENMEDCLFTVLVLKEYLDGEYNLLEGERLELLSEMESMYNEYSDLLSKAKIAEAKKKKKMTLELMSLREDLFMKKDSLKSIASKIKENRELYAEATMLASKETLQEIAADNKLLNRLASEKRDVKEELNKETVKQQRATKPVEKLAENVEKLVAKTPESEATNQVKPDRNPFEEMPDMSSLPPRPSP